MEMSERTDSRGYDRNFGNMDFHNFSEKAATMAGMRGIAVLRESPAQPSGTDRCSTP